MLPAALAYPYNDTLANDSTLILTASGEIYRLSPDGNYNVYIELENDSSIINYSDIDFEIYGWRKLVIRSYPRIFAIPMAISEYPEKSQ